MRRAEPGNHARMLLGFAVKVLGPDGRGLPTSDARRPQNDPSLAVSLEHATAALAWLVRCDLRYWRLSSDLAPFATDGRYVNDVVEVGADVPRTIYGDAKYERLVALKREWDPDNVFRLNQNIQP